MRIEVLKSKLHLARVTDGDVHYEGSLGIDVELMNAVGLCPYEKVLVSNVNNGSRFETYVIPEFSGSRRIVLNGAAARLGAVGDPIIIMSFAHVKESEVKEGKHRPRVLRLDENNEPDQWIPTPTSSDQISSMIGG